MYGIEGRQNPLQLGDTHAGQIGSHTVLGAPAVIGGTFGRGRRQRTATDHPLNGLLTNKLLGALPGEDFARILPALQPVFLSPGEDLYGLGESIYFTYFPETAVISHLYVLADGNTTEATLIGREGMTGLSVIFNSPPPTHWTRATVGGIALGIRTEVIKQEFSRGGALQRLLLGYAGERLAQLSRRAVCNGRHGVEERLCSWLLMVHDRAGEDQLPLTHEQIAGHLGVRRSGVSEVAYKLQKMGMISYQRGHVRVLDREGMEELACECYPVARANFDGFSEGHKFKLQRRAG